MTKRELTMLVAVALAVGCSPAPTGLARSKPAAVTVKMDFFNKPLPEIALPNDIATRYDENSPTKRRINASMIAPTAFEARTRQRLDDLDGWGVMQAITVPFTGTIDVNSVVDRHDDVDYDSRDDAIYVLYLGPDESRIGEVHHLDIGNGNYPAVLERRDLYYKNDPRGDSMTLFYEEADEDLNRNGVLDPGEDADGDGVLDEGEDLDGDGKLDPPEDTDADGILDRPNYLPGMHPSSDDLAARADAVMTFYERSSNTLIARPLVPFDDASTYAVVVTRRIFDLAGDPVGSPYPFINHVAQTDTLEPLLRHLPDGLAVGDIAFAYSFTTQTIKSEWQAVRDGLYGHGPQQHLAGEYPASVDELLPMRDAAFFPDMTMPHLLYGEVWKPALAELSGQLLGQSAGEGLDAIVDGTDWVDWYAVGSYTSPQLFPRLDGSGEPLPLNDQVWPPNLGRDIAPARGEQIYFTLSVPRKEVSARGDGKPAPVVILGHGYTGNRFDVMQMSSYFARHGFAVIGIDGPSHGISISSADESLAKVLLTAFGVSNAGEALLRDRAFDQNGDGITDSGADFWSSYLFHTRDMVRQFALDYMQLVRMVRGFDGTARWDFDLDGDGENELAGDFDADGLMDISAESELYVFGGSLGGIMSMVLGAVDPAITAIAPVSGGGGYGDMGPRSTQGGVYQAFILRVMGPLFVGTTDPDTGEMLLETIVVDLNDDQTIPIGSISGITPWDTMVVENLRNGVRRCGYVSPDGTVRASAEADELDPLRITFYKGPQLDPASEHCALLRDVEPFVVVDSFSDPFVYQAVSFDAGSALVALQEGLGMRRGHPDFRRLGNLGQLVLDPADPAVLARNLLLDPLSYAGTNETTGAHSLIITTMGDTAVPVSGGAAVGRAAGLVDYLEIDDRYGVPPNQELIDNFTIEGVHNLKRYTNSSGDGVHLDVENFSGGSDMFGTEVPRLDPPLRLGLGATDPLGGKSAAIFPYNVPTGQHGFDFPGMMTDKAREQCREQCTEMGPDPCGCDTLETFDIGYFMMNMVGRYFGSAGHVLSTDLCMSRNDCDNLPAAPTNRDVMTLP